MEPTLDASLSRYRKRPVEVVACRFFSRTGPAIAAWCGGRYVVGTDDPMDDGEALFIPTLEGVMRADVGDWIIRGVAGEFYPCKPDIFAATYEPVAL